MRKFPSPIAVFLTGIFAAACASVATPGGGPYDETPPKFLSSTPAMNQTQVKKGKLELVFNENIALESVSEKVIISPPQIKMPTIKGIAKKVTVEFQDTLIDNTTYTIDFNDAIVDNNEKNPLEGFSFAFSTGDVIDSLAISGTLLNAGDLEPMQNVIIGLHRNLDDSAFVKLPFVRTSKTNDRGKFTIRNIAEGEYHIFALKDNNNNYRFDQKEEEIAFLDSLIIPKFELLMRTDTVWKDSITVDTVNLVAYNRFYPDNLMLMLFKEESHDQFLEKTERPFPERFTFTFGNSLYRMPEFRLLGEENIHSDLLFFPQLTEGKKVLTLWLRDSTYIARDSLAIEITYEKSDSLFRPVAQTDTIRFFPKKTGRAAPSKKEQEIVDTTQVDPSFTIKVEASSTMDVFGFPVIEFPEPVLFFDSTQIRLEVKQDTLWTPYAFRLQQDTVNALLYKIVGRWNYDHSYRMSIDSGAVYNIYGRANLPVSSEFRAKPENSYSHLYFNLPDLPSPAFVELLDASDKVVRTTRVREKGALFRNVAPGKYYARMFLDLNGNGQWDTGNYEEKRQPEPVYYYSSVIELMQNWEVEQTWEVYDLPVEKQKPAEVTQNKPQEKTRRESKNQQNRDQQQSRGQQQNINPSQLRNTFR